MRFPTAFILLATLFPSLALGQNASQQECLFSALKVCAIHVLQDQAGILASPVRTSPRDLLWIVPFGVATGVAIDYDAHAMRSLGVDPKRQDRFQTVSNAGAFYAPIAASGAGYFIGGITHNDLMRETAVLSAEAMVDATILNQGLKYAINRQDPQQGDGTGRFWPHGLKTWPDGQSMPSEHAMNVWAFAHVVATQYSGPATKAIVYSLATTVSVSRVMARQHFPSDVLVGSVFGYLIGGYVEHRRSREAGYLSLSSVTTPNGRGLQLSYNFAH
jgi:membrane-associated phospholipid phosphatase